jgi:tetratricopeptide (TPR) repeat protein
VTTAPQAAAPAKGKRLLLLLAAVLLLAGAAAGGYFAWRPRPPAVPAVPTEGLDAEVAAAINEARADVAARPKSAAAWGHLGLVLFAQEMYVPCVAPLAEAERLDPRDARWPYFRGLALVLHEPDEGIALLERAAKLAPDDLSVRLRLAEEYLKRDRTDEADALFRALLAEHPNNPRALLGHGQLLSRRGRWREAVVPLTEAAGHPTARRSARVALAEAYLRLGDGKAAEAERKRAAETPDELAWPDTFLAEARALQTGLQPRINLALDFATKGQIGEAAALAERVLRDHPGSDEAHLAMAKVLIQAGHFGGAENELRQALRLGPDLVEGHFLLAGVLTLRKDYPGAEREWRRTVALRPAYGLAHYHLGDCLLKQGKKPEALDAARAAVRCRPDLAVAQAQLGALLLEGGHVEEAVAHLDAAVRLDGQNEKARGLLEQARAKKGPCRARGNAKRARPREGPRPALLSFPRNGGPARAAAGSVSGTVWWAPAAPSAPAPWRGRRPSCSRPPRRPAPGPGVAGGTGGS